MLTVPIDLVIVLDFLKPISVRYFIAVMPKPREPHWTRKGITIKKPIQKKGNITYYKIQF